MTSQQRADLALLHWQSLRHLPPAQRIKIVMKEIPNA